MSGAFSPNKSLTTLYFTVYKDFDAMKAIYNNNIICMLKDIHASIGNTTQALKYSCGDAGTIDNSYLIPLSNNQGLSITVQNDSIQDDTEISRQYSSVSPEIMSRILSTFTFTK